MRLETFEIKNGVQYNYEFAVTPTETNVNVTLKSYSEQLVGAKNHEKYWDAASPVCLNNIQREEIVIPSTTVLWALTKVKDSVKVI